MEKGTGALLVNEIAPRVHNSGHHTIEANATSQFARCPRADSKDVFMELFGDPPFRAPQAQLVRVAIDLPVGSVTATRAAAASLQRPTTGLDV